VGNEGAVAVAGRVRSEHRHVSASGHQDEEWEEPSGMKRKGGGGRRRDGLLSDDAMPRATVSSVKLLLAVHGDVLIAR
jgi:hypothetical protein